MKFHLFKLDGARGGARTEVAKTTIAPPAGPAKAPLRKERKLIKANANANVDKDGDWKEF